MDITRTTASIKNSNAALSGFFKGLSTGLAWLAVAAACATLILDGLHLAGAIPAGWKVQSAFPLLFVGASYASLQFGAPSTWREKVLGLSVGVAFMMWGGEQFVPQANVRALMEDGVMFLFVLDLGLVIFNRLKERRE